MQSLDNAAAAPLSAGQPAAAPLVAPAPAPIPHDILLLRAIDDRLVLRVIRVGTADDTVGIEVSAESAALTAIAAALSDPESDPERGRSLLRRALRVGTRQVADDATRRALAELPLFLAAPGAPDPDAPAAHAAHAADIVHRAVARALLISAGEDPARLERRDGRVTVDRACGFMVTHITRPLDLADVVRASDISSRTLQYAFQTRFGMSPMRWLREQRLRRLHAALRAAPADVGVTELAAGLGFTHLGRLGQVFEQRFGLLPRHLLRRARLG